VRVKRNVPDRHGGSWVRMELRDEWITFVVWGEAGSKVLFKLLSLLCWSELALWWSSVESKVVGLVR
jgi:hypothetical protein